MLRRIFFFTWFLAHGAPEPVSWKEATTGFCFIILLLAIRWRAEKAWLVRLSPDMPKAFLRACLTLSLLGLVGWFSNGITGAVNAAKMPVDTTYADSAITNKAVHTAFSADTKFQYIADILIVRLSRLLLYFFPGYANVSIGDLLIAASIIFSWWLALATVLWAAYASFKKYVSF